MHFDTRGKHRRAGGEVGEAGFSLVIVLGLIGALALACAVFVQVVRSHLRAAAGAVTEAALEALADGGVHLAIADIVASRADRMGRRRFALDGAPTFCSPASGVVLALQVRDEAGKIDLNIASDAMLRALVRGVGIARADAVTDAILDYKDPDDDRRPGGAEVSDYRAAGRRSGPKNAPFQSWEELGQVLGMPADGPALLRPYVTVYSGQATFDSLAAVPGLAEILVRGLSMEGDGAEAAATLPPEFVGASVRRAFNVRVEARKESAAFVREAVIEMTSSPARPYFVRRWVRAPELRLERIQTPDGLPPC